MNLLPEPIEMTNLEGCFSFLTESEIILTAQCNGEDLESAKLLQQEILDTLKIEVSINKSFHTTHYQGIMLKKLPLNDESYEIVITPDGIVISGDTLGLFYGVQTLRQMIRIHYRNIPCTHIKDKPYFSNRGFYHDVTRGKVPKLETLMQLVDRAAFYKINEIQLYIEHSFAFKNHSEVWAGSDPLTAEEILLLDEYCRKRHIDLVPSIATFGHLYEVLRTHSFHNICELENSMNEPYSWIDRMHHHTVDVTSNDSIAYVEKILKEFVPLFSSGKFNICCDETFDLGEGKSKNAAKEVGKGKLYVDFLNKVIGLIKRYDKKVMFWGDIILSHPEYVSEIPNDTILLNWDYAANPDEEKIKIASKFNRKQYLCPGVGCWNRLIAVQEDVFSNISKMVEFAVKYEACGILNTDWGDFGHINTLGASIPGMIYGAALSWNPNMADTQEQLNQKISQIEYRDSSKQLLGLIKELGNLQAFDWFNIVWWLERDRVDNLSNLDETDLLNKYTKAIEIEKKLIDYMSLSTEQTKLDIEEFCISARGIALFNLLALSIKKFELNEDIRVLTLQPKELAVKLEYWLCNYMEIWRTRNKESELFRIKDTIKAICSRLRGYTC